VLGLSSGLALLSLTKFSRIISRPAAQHPLWAAGLRRRRQKAEQADRGLPPRLLLQGRGGDLVLSPSSGLALLFLPLPLSSPSATKFSRPAAQHPLWAGLRRRRQKAERSLSSALAPACGLALLSALSPSQLLSARRRPPTFCGLRRSTRFGLACGAESRASSKQTGDYPLLQGGGRVIWFSAAAVSTSCFLLLIA
jgi:hypothetical protein